MNYQEKKLDQLWSFIVKAPGRCLFCGSTFDLQPHHIFFGRHKSNWFFRWTPIFGVSLCGICHLTNSTAPHKDSYCFWVKLESILKHTDPERLKQLFYWKNTKIDIPEFPGYEVLRADLEQQAQKAIEQAEAIRESYQETFKGRINGQEIWT